MRKIPLSTFCLAVPVWLLGCTGNSEGSSGASNDTSSKTAAQAPPPPPAPTIKLVVDISNRQLSVLRSTDTLERFPIAVGKAKHPTPTGDFKISRIDFNPDWTPPDSEWSKDESYKKPGHPDNPMGRARIVYQMPYTIHGTKDINSLGEAESHGSIRMANNDVIALAKLIMKESGTEKPEEWYNKVLQDSTKMVPVDLTNEIPLTNVK